MSELAGCLKKTAIARFCNNNCFNFMWSETMDLFERWNNERRFSAVQGTQNFPISVFTENFVNASYISVIFHVCENVEGLCKHGGYFRAVLILFICKYIWKSVVV